MQRLLREPLLHFLLLGSLLHITEAYWRPALMPEVIHISVAEQRVLHERWRVTTGRRATNAEMAALLEQAIDEEILLREARQLGLHERDPVVRDRLLRNMRFIDPGAAVEETALLKAAVSLGMVEADAVIRRRLLQRMRHRIESGVEISQQEAQRYFAERSDAARQPARYSFSQIYLANPDSARLEAVKQALAQGTQPEQLGDAFLLGQQFQQLTRADIRSQLGEQVAHRVANGQQGEWQGPVSSPYGLHYLRLDAFEPARPASHAQAGRRLTAELITERETATLRKTLDRLRRRYQIEIEGAAS